jgi:hypothetical protein
VERGCSLGRHTRHTREDLAPPVRLEDMPYSTYEDARACERELLSLAQKQRIGSEPRRARRSFFSADKILAALRRRPEPAREPAVSRTG